MKIDFDGIQAFVLIAELGGFGKAAERLHLTQTALTRRIQKLESYIGVRLIDRTTRSVQLTAVGREFLPHAARMVTDMTLAVGRLKDMHKLARKQAIRDGSISAPPRKKKDDARRPSVAAGAT